MKVLLAGESWITIHIHVKGADSFTDSTYEEGADALRNALSGHGIEVDYLPNHVCGTKFPTSIDELAGYSAVLLSDIGANTLLLHPRTFTGLERTPNRLEALKAYVHRGGGLCMIGGYLTFMGMEARGCWRETAVEEVLPVKLHASDDRVEKPEGVVPKVLMPEHPILEGIAGPWPFFLGYNRLEARPDANVIMAVGDHPFLAGRAVGNGRTAIFASDCAPHWGPPEFMSWKHYGRLWGQLVEWLAHKR